ncbi:hypothetical protein T484DRAFT_1831288, partial [Baffinella frigidus]
MCSSAALDFTTDIPKLQQSVVVVDIPTGGDNLCVPAGVSVVVVGFPTGGDNLCVTAGVVSRVDVHEYAHSGFSLLCVQ